ncbi:MAG: hypothetical protein K2G69_03925 [Muribaculaceae bacterium]|nr:hypothetical protein [Muribaculaceae bacterium]
MRTRFLLHTANHVYELQDDDLSNWDEVRCSLKRSDLGGVVRSFSSEFRFVRNAYDILLDIYLADGINGCASIEIQTQTDNWEWESRFSSPLDFSTIQLEGETLMLNCIDNDLAAIIKANKGVKYELAIGQDIKVSDVMRFDRIPVIESATYGFTQGYSYSNIPDIIVTFKKDIMPWVGLVADEILVNGTIHFLDDQEDTSESYVLKAEKDAEVTLDWDFSWRKDHQGAVSLYLLVRHNGTLEPLSAKNFICEPGGMQYYFKGDFAKASQLPASATINKEEAPRTYAIVDGIVFDMVANYYGNDATMSYQWRDTGKTSDEYFVSSEKGSLTVSLTQGDCLVIYGRPISPMTSTSIRFVSSSMKFKWSAIGDTINIDVLSPQEVCRTLLCKMAEDYGNFIDVEISGHDQRIKDTVLLASESIRGLREAKFYSSFNDFCEWMSVVFGYVYEITAPQPCPFVGVSEAGQTFFTPWAYDENDYINASDVANIVYVSGHGRFFYRSGDRLYPHWTTEGDYNLNDSPRGDVLFRLPSYGDGLYRFVEGNAMPQRTEWKESDLGKGNQIVRFLHRSELFDCDNDRTFADINGVKYSVDTAQIYSSVIIGYGKQDYDSVNGRDEFNFNNTYTTGCTVSNKKLSLISPYRADSFGVEFAAQKRGEDTTDKSSDTDVFFILCAKDEDGLYPDRSLVIENSISGRLFNGAFCPMACVEANAGFIGMQTTPLQLTFASSEGNSSIVINGKPMSGDITLQSPIASVGRVEFTTSEIVELENPNMLIRFSDDGLTYAGFLMECDHRYAKNAAVTYKLIVKEVKR